MDLMVLSVAMLIVLLLAIYAMTRGSAIEAEIQRLVDQVPIEQIYADYRSNNFTLNLYVVGGILLTGAFALIFFGAGGLDPREWGLVNWLFAVIGMTATVAITLGQRNLYSSIRQNIAALLVTLLILSFVIFSEVATSSEREDSLVRDRSLNSPTLAAVLDKISSPDVVPHSYEAHYRSEAARYRSLAGQCSGQCKRANLAKAEGFEAKARAEQSRIQTALLAQQANKQALVETSKGLEYVEQNHTAVIRWLKEISASTWTAAMMFASLIFVIAFESGFHFTGTRNGIYIEALSRLGYSVKRKVKHPTLVPDSQNAGNRIAKQPTRINTDNGSVCDTDKNSEERGERAQTEIADMELFLQNAKNAKVGEVVICPNCAEEFRKRTYNQCFCCKGCKDNYWNLVKPERLVAARGGVT
ncbi:MAG: hypothetical protein ACPGSM_22255 [Thiolinea sp.]